MADKNEAQIVIKTINDTDGGFKEVASNFEDFDKEIQNLEKNLKPLQTLLDAGIASGAGLSAVSAYTKNLGDMGGTLSDLKSSFLGISDAAGSAGASIDAFGSTMSVFSEAANWATRFAVAVKGAFEVGKKLKQAYAAANVLIAEHKLMQEAAAVATAASTATTTANAAATAAEATAKEAASATFVADTISETVNTVATSANTAAKGTNAAATATAATSNGVLAAASWVATAAVSALNIALALNPFAVYAAAIAATIGVLWGACKSVGALCTYLNNTHEETAKAAEQTQKLREEYEKNREECEKYGARLEKLQEKEKLSASEREESARVVAELNGRYEGLNLTLDATTGKVKNAAGAFVNLHKVMAEQAAAKLDAEISAAKENLAALKNDLDAAENSWWIGGEEELKEQISAQETALEEAKAKRLEVANEITDIELAQQQKVAKQKKKDAEEVAEALKANANLVADLEKQIADETKSAQQKELDALREKIALREKEIEALRESGKLTDAQAASELAKLHTLEAQRAAQINSKYEAEAAAKAQEEARKAREEAEKEKKAAEDRRMWRRFGPRSRRARPFRFRLRIPRWVPFRETLSSRKWMRRARTEKSFRGTWN